jgi:hypothetical protein
MPLSLACCGVRRILDQEIERIILPPVFALLEKLTATSPIELVFWISRYGKQMDRPFVTS